ncbi:hypothetical protein Igag_1660 [Ignisphaera aggregans DSM 17230]|uniref:Flagellin n=1 Tax=Ignisphaera aggregans (strain DSM 17230 / JCM 13409 / AQ1.S1) TaxID=583356 RepID=E0SRS7_IGNAA|nr:hypothetical protein Igag_1660 [Ignisphaera aggregans DSM 17230]
MELERDYIYISLYLWKRDSFSGDSLRAVSEYTATIIMIIITLVIGATMVLYINSIADRYYSALATRLTAVEGGSIDIMVSHIDRNNNIVTIIATGSQAIQIYAVYINETLTICTLYRDDGSRDTINGVNRVYVPQLSIASIQCPCPTASCVLCNIKIIYSGGEIYAMASKI